MFKIDGQRRRKEGRSVSVPIQKKYPPTVDFFRPKEGEFVDTPQPPSQKSKDQFKDAPSQNPFDFFKGFSVGSLFTFGVNQVAAKYTPPQVGWLDFFAQLAGSVEALDLDLYDVPTNRGTGLCRFSEYTPRASRPEDCTVSIAANTKARVHGEIRPIKDTQESLITRLTIDYTPNVISLIKTWPNLEIDGFSAVDSPDIEFDQKFLTRDKSVKSVKGGDFSYENPLANSTSLASAFDSQANPPPDGHRDWMFRFMPVEKNAFAALEESIADGKGPLLLWAFLPTVGLQDPDNYKKFGIRYNTFPRHFGDLVKFLSPMFDPKLGPALKQSAPYINPNSEYIDSEGNRKKIPDDANEVIKINEERAKFGRPAIGRNRGTIIDWIFTDLANDPERVQSIKKSDFPKIIGHVRLRDTLLQLPIGQIGLSRTTDIKANYHFSTYKDDTGTLRPRLGLTANVEPLSLNNIELVMGGFHLKAKTFSAKKVKVTMPSFSSLIKNAPAEDLPITVRIEGLKVEDLLLEDATGSVKVEMASGELGVVEFSKSKKSLVIEINGLKEDSLQLKFPAGELSVKKAEIPAETDEKAPKKLSVVQSFDEAGKPTQLTVKVPELLSSGGITLGQSNGAASLEMQGSSKLSNVEFYKKEEKDGSRLMASFDFNGGVDVGRVKYGPLGIVNFNTVEESGASPTRHQLSGKFNLNLVLPKDPTQAKPAPDYSLTMQVPYFDFDTEGRLSMKPGGSKVRNGSLSVSTGAVSVEGDLDINATQLLGLGSGPTELGRFLLSENSPNIQDLTIGGRAKFEFKKDGWSLRKSTDSSTPLKLGFRIKDTEFRHHPDLDKTPIEGLPANKVVGTKVQLKEAEVEVGDLRKIEYSQFMVDGEKRGRLSYLDAGPISIHQIKGSGSIWVNLAIWGFVRGLFPSLGTLGGGDGKALWAQRPSSAPLTQHLPEPVQKQLGKGDFFRLEKIFFRQSGNGDWTSQFEDLLLNLHEDGGRAQFGMIRIPNLDLNLKADPSDSTQKNFTFDFGKGDFFVNIYLNDPDRGGSFHFKRWPKTTK